VLRHPDTGKARIINTQIREGHSMSDELQGRVAIVTGASRGIGQACAEALLKAGATVVGCSRSAAMEAHTSDRYHHRIVDVAEVEPVADLIAWTTGRFGRLDVLVNNVGTHPPTQPIDAFSVDDFDQLFRLNLRSVFVACQLGLPALRQARGSIINIGSAVGLHGQEGAVTYCATKAGISGFTKALAIDEAPHGVRVNTVCPGAILTPLAKETHPKERRETIASWSWMDRWGQPEEVAELVLFLASDRSSFMTGQDLEIGGGTDLGYGLKGPAYYRALGTDPPSASD
jgi:NAD(P)-dependent dehydrogenase (short-subunit alcohol dehydrogenase family)